MGEVRKAIQDVQTELNEKVELLKKSQTEMVVEMLMLAVFCLGLLFLLR